MNFKVKIIFITPVDLLKKSAATAAVCQQGKATVSDRRTVTTFRPGKAWFV